MIDNSKEEYSTVETGNAIVITGATRGLGAALTKHFALNGKNVVMNFRNRTAADRVLAQIAEMGSSGHVIPVQADVRDRIAVKAMFEVAESEFGGANVLINSAGINLDAPFLDITDENWDAVVDTHLKGTFICSQEFVRHTGERSANIINLGASCGIQGRLNGANFCSAKGGVHALTKCMARELAPRIRVNCLTPNAVDTEEVRERYALDTESGMQKVLSVIPMGRLGAHDEVTHMVDSILRASFSTGATFFVNGGEYM